MVLGLRDVLDDPRRTRREWDDQRATAAVDRWYDQLWVYSDPRVQDPIADCRLPAALRSITRYTGYLGWGRAGLESPPATRRVIVPDPPYVLGSSVVARTAPRWPAPSPPRPSPPATGPS